MLRLIIDEKDRMVQGASVPLRWCVSKEVLEVLKERKVTNPYILIVTVADRQEMMRQLFPMEEMMTYIQFARPGENTIFAQVVWSDDGKFNSLWEEYLRKSRGKYETDVVNSEGKMMGSEHGLLKPAEVTVVVPEEVFAKEPPEWETKWVNAYFSQPPRDQCEYRKRRLIAYTLQPIWFVMRFVVGIFVAIFALLCGKWPDLKPLVYLSVNLTDVFNNGTESIVIRRWKDVDWHSRKFLFLLPLAPIFWLFCFIILWFAKYKGEGPDMWIMAISITIVLTICLMAIGAVVDGLRGLAYLLDKYLDKKVRPGAKERSARREQEMFKLRYETEFEPLLCDGRDLKPSIADLPPERRTVHLRFLDLKAKVCRPFAK